MTQEELTALREAKPSWVGKTPLVVRPPATRPAGWPVVANESAPSQMSQQFLPDYRGDSEHIQELDYDAGTSDAFVDTWDRTTGLGVSWKGTRVYEVDAGTFTLVQTVTKYTTPVTESTSTSADDALAADAVSDVYAYPFAATSPSVYDYIARAADSGTQVSVPKWGGAEGSIKTVDFGGSTTTSTSQLTLIQSTDVSKNINVYQAGGVATVPNASGVVGTKVSLVDVTSTISVVTSVTDNLTDVVYNVTTTTKTLKVINRFEFSRERVYDSNGSLYSMSAEFLVRQTSYLTEG